jgi:hypothetical protein
MLLLVISDHRGYTAISFSQDLRYFGRDIKTASALVFEVISTNTAEHTLFFASSASPKVCYHNPVADCSIYSPASAPRMRWPGLVSLSLTLATGFLLLLLR